MIQHLFICSSLSSWVGWSWPFLLGNFWFMNASKGVTAKAKIWQLSPLHPPWIKWINGIRQDSILSWPKCVCFHLWISRGGIHCFLFPSGAGAWRRVCLCIVTRPFTPRIPMTANLFPALPPITMHQKMDQAIINWHFKFSTTWPDAPSEFVCFGHLNCVLTGPCASLEISFIRWMCPPPPSRLSLAFCRDQTTSPPHRQVRFFLQPSEGLLDNGGRLGTVGARAAHLACNNEKIVLFWRCKKGLFQTLWQYVWTPLFFCLCLGNHSLIFPHHKMFCAMQY